LRDWNTESDAGLDPQAYVLRPDVVLDLAGQIIAEPTPYLRTRRAAQAVLAKLGQAAAAGAFSLSRLETRWLARLTAQADELPENEDELIAEMVGKVDKSKVRLEEYGI
jgi:methanol---5-hydroxybenzimidazolylcobamide Co-methyltransferase